jgi:hypothetical protein
MVIDRPFGTGSIAGLVLALGWSFVASAETGTPPAGGGFVDRGLHEEPILAAGALIVAAVAIRFPRSRRPIAALLVVGAAVVVAFWIVIIGSWATSTTGGGLPPQASLGALAALGLGLVLAGAILVGGGRDRGGASRE